MALGDLRKIEARYKHTRHWLWYITAISFITGALLAACLRTQREWRARLGIRTWRPEAIGAYLRDARDESGRLREEVETLRAKNTEYEEELAKGGHAQQLLNEELQAHKVLVGLTEVEGPGVIVTMRDSTLRPPPNSSPGEIEAYLLHDYDILRVVNELRAAGAEAIAINGQRVVERTAIRCVGPVTRVNNVAIGTPYRISAIGDVQALYSGLTIPGGIMDWLKEMTFPATVEKRAHIVIPAYKGPLELLHARPVGPKDGGKEKDR